MPIVRDRNHVLEVYEEAASRKWVLPTFNSENLTTTEAILSAVYQYGKRSGIFNLPIIIGITNKYAQRPQSVYYTHTHNWEIGLNLFLADLEALVAPGTLFSDLRVMIHLDHIQWDHDKELLNRDLRLFSSIMYDASTLPLEKNVKHTCHFVNKFHNMLVIEGICDEIIAASDIEDVRLTTPEIAEKYFHDTGIDILVANLGTEHRATTARLEYRSDIAKAISKRIGPHLCLHGTSSVSAAKLKNLFADGICKVNIWTTLERDSSPILFQEMLKNAIKIIGPEKARELISKDLLGEKVDLNGGISITHFTTTYRQQIIFQQMIEIINKYLKTWYV